MAFDLNQRRIPLPSAACCKPQTAQATAVAVYGGSGRLLCAHDADYDMQGLITLKCVVAHTHQELVIPGLVAD